MDTTLRLTYVGPAPYAGALAQELEEHGILAEYNPPFERKDLSTALETVTVIFAVTGPIGGVVAGVRAFRARHHGTRVEGLPDEASVVRDRLAKVDALLSDGSINAEEHAAQRARILDEL
jgi:hypothetical protein